MAKEVAEYGSVRMMCFAVIDRLRKLPSNIKTYWRDEGTEDEGYAPAPCVQLFSGQRGRQDHASQTSEEHRELLTVALPRGKGSTFLDRRRFEQIRRRRSDFAAAG